MTYFTNALFPIITNAEVEDFLKEVFWGLLNQSSQNVTYVEEIRISRDDMPL